MPRVVQRQLIQARSQTRRWRFSRPGLVRPMLPIVCTRQRPRADFPRVCVFTALLSLFVHVPLVYACQRTTDFPCVCIDIHSCAPFVCAGQRPRGRPPSCSCRHSQPPPPRLCMPTHEGLIVFAPAFTAGFPRFCTPLPEGLLPSCPHHRSQLPPPQVSGSGSDLRSRFAQPVEPGPPG